MVSRATKIRLGVFIAIGSLLIIVFAAAVAGSRLVQKRDIYYIQFENYSVSGLQVGGAVNYQGIKVGRVENIKIDPQNVTKIILTISVEAGTPIKKDTEAILTLVGITGLKSVEIRGGTNESALLKPKSFIKAGVSMFDDISDRAMSIAEKIDLIASNLSELTSSENQKNIANILAQTSMLITDTRANMSTTLVSLSRIANNTADLTTGLSKNLDALTQNLTKNMDSITLSTTKGIDSLSLAGVKSLEEVTRNLNKELTVITANLDKSLAQITSQSNALIDDARLQINTVGGHTDQLVLETTKQITTLSSNLNRSLDQLNTLLYSPEFTRLMDNLSKLSGQLADADLKGMVVELNSTIQKAGILTSNLNRVVVRGQSNLLDMLDSLAEASENLNEFSRQISETPSILLRGN
jgi:ABC-type transporter Mla subunit MlaD